MENGRIITTPPFHSLESQVWRISGFITWYLSTWYNVKLNYERVRAKIRPFITTDFAVYKQFSDWLYQLLDEQINTALEGTSVEPNFDEFFRFVCGYFEAVISQLQN